MSVIDYLPKYHQIEANNLKALQPGFVVAQLPFKADDVLLQEKWNKIDSTSESYTTKVANGHIVTLCEDGLKHVEAVTASVASSAVTMVPAEPLFITYNDPLNTLVNANRFYATDLDEERVRAVQLIPGDEWMSDIDYFAQSDSTYVYPGAALLVGRIMKIASTNSSSGIYNSDDWFAMNTLPDGTTAYHYVFVK